MLFPNEIRYTEPVDTSLKHKKKSLILISKKGCQFCRRTRDYICQPLKHYGILTVKEYDFNYHANKIVEFIQGVVKDLTNRGPPILVLTHERRNEYGEMEYVDPVLYGWSVDESLEAFRDRMYREISREVVEAPIPQFVYIDIPDREKISEEERKSLLKRSKAIATEKEAPAFGPNVPR